MAKIQLDLSKEIHSKIKKIQIEKDLKNEDKNLKEVYEELILLGIEEYNKKASQK